MNDTVNEEGRLPVPLKVFGVLSIVGGLASLGDLAPVIFSFVQGVGAIAEPTRRRRRTPSRRSPCWPSSAR